MRYTRYVIAIIFTAALIFSLVVNVAAASSEQSYELVVFKGEAEYKNGHYRMYTPISNRDNYVFSAIPNAIAVDNVNMPLLSFTSLAYSDTILPFTNGYVYTFNYTITLSGVDTSELPTITFGLAELNDSESAISNYIPLAETTYTYTITTSVSYNLYCTSVLEVTPETNFGTISDPSRAYIAITMDAGFSATNVTILNTRWSAKQTIGEGAYYQASLDAINNLPETEYNYIYNKLPDANGDVELIQSDLEDLTEDLELITSDFYEMIMGIESQEPLIYMPRMYIPHLDIDLTGTDYFGSYIDGQGYFKPVSMLQSMDPGFMNNFLLVMSFLRFILIITFVTVGLCKMVRIEWWL